MRQDIRLGRVAGIAVGANWTVGVILVLAAWLLGASVLPGAFPHQSRGLYWSAAVAGAMFFLASLLAHETAHAVVARRNGVRVRSITLTGIGGGRHRRARRLADRADAGRKMRLSRASAADSDWMCRVLDRVSQGFGARLTGQPDGSLRLRPAAA